MTQVQARGGKRLGDDQTNWVTAFFMAAFHLGAVAALFFFTWKAVLVAAFLWWISGSLGIGIGYHRLLTHRSYTAPKWVEYFLTVCATLTLEGGPIFWVATHRIHHQFADQEGDPLTARWQMVVPYGLDSYRKIHAPRHNYAGPLRSRPC
jgi:fatty-acid desaturase